MGRTQWLHWTSGRGQLVKWALEPSACVNESAKIVVRIPADARVRSQWASVLNSTPGLHTKILRDLYSGDSAAAASEDVSKYAVKKLEVQVVNVNNVKAYSVEITFEVANDKAATTNHRGTLMVTSTGEVHSYIDDPNFDE